MRLHSLLLSVVASFLSVHAIFSDDAYHIDYHQALLGIPQSQSTFFLRPQASSSATLLYTLSSKAVLGAVNPKDGSVVWRHALAGEPVGNGTNARLVAEDGDGKVISSFGQEISAWDALDGKLVWAESIPGTAHILGLETVSTPNSGSGANTVDVIALAGDHHASGSTTKVLKLAGSDGRSIWEYSDHRSVHFQGSGTRLTDVVETSPCWSAHQQQKCTLYRNILL
jgi:ER membrane protein complex subunit 1